MSRVPISGAKYSQRVACIYAPVLNYVVDDSPLIRIKGESDRFAQHFVCLTIKSIGPIGNIIEQCCADVIGIIFVVNCR